MSEIKWSDGRLITLEGGDTATCSGGLNRGQLYALFFYNSAGHDTNATVSVVYSNTQEPVDVTVPGTTANQGLAALCFVSGDNTNTVSASLTGVEPGVQIQAFIGSVKMPTNTNGINNEALPMDGQFHPFEKFTRFYAVPASHWYSASLKSDINQFIAVQFKQNKAEVFILNSTTDPGNTIAFCGETKKQVTVNPINHQTCSWKLQGNGTQWVWINADSTENSRVAKISVQSLSNAYASFNA